MSSVRVIVEIQATVNLGGLPLACDEGEVMLEA